MLIAATHTLQADVPVILRVSDSETTHPLDVYVSKMPTKGQLFAVDANGNRTRIYTPYNPFDVGDQVASHNDALQCSPAWLLQDTLRDARSYRDLLQDLGSAGYSTKRPPHNCSPTCLSAGEPLSCADDR